MTGLAITIALISLVGFIFTWLRLTNLKATLARLEQGQSPSVEPKVIPFETFPPFTVPPTDLAPDVDPNAGHLIILGYRNDIIILENQSSGEHIVTKDVAVPIPRGTTEVLPLMTGYNLLFGDISKVKDAVEGDFSYELEDHKFSNALANVRVVEIGGVTEFGTVTATLQVQMLLRDSDGDDEWAGWMHLHILFLGPHP